jgi:hypothetical protein
MALSDLLKMETMAAPQTQGTPPMAAPAAQPRMIQGQGTGQSDSVPGNIEGEQPIETSDGEYIVPADVVAMLGDGSSQAGARVLENLINEIRGLKQGGDESQQESLSTLLG